MKERCAWLNPDNALYAAYHDVEWGVPVHDDRALFEMLILEGAQAGLSWETILKKRENYRRAFRNFDVDAILKFTEADEDALMQDAGIVRNRLKIKSVRINAAACRAIRNEFGSFDAYLWGFVGNEPVDGRFASLADIPTKDAVSDALSSDLKKRGMKFVGSTIVYAFMQAVGMVNAHTTNCFRYKEVKKK
jgi:DNA-3-methyladenine glycosylase I